MELSFASNQGSLILHEQLRQEPNLHHGTALFCPLITGCSSGLAHRGGQGLGWMMDGIRYRHLLRARRAHDKKSHVLVPSIGLGDYLRRHSQSTSYE